MTRFQLAVLLTLLSGCGVETVGTAAVGAAAKAQEARQAQQLKQDLQNKLDAAAQSEQQQLKDNEAKASGGY